LNVYEGVIAKLKTVVSDLGVVHFSGQRTGLIQVIHAIIVHHTREWSFGKGKKFFEIPGIVPQLWRGVVGCYEV
jgi:hypothetical protein